VPSAMWSVAQVDPGYAIKKIPSMVLTTLRVQEDSEVVWSTRYFLLSIKAFNILHFKNRQMLPLSNWTREKNHVQQLTFLMVLTFYGLPC
jgi:hypothetical protein